MPEEVRATRTRAPTADEEALQTWFAEQENDPSKHLDEGAKQLISLVSAMYTVIFGILALAGDPVPGYLVQQNIRVLGTLVVISYLLALLASLVVVLPSTHRYASASQTQKQHVFDAIMQRKRWGLWIAMIAFGAGSVGFAMLFVMILFGM